MEIKLIRTEEGLKEIRPLWNELLSKNLRKDISLTYEWFETWYEIKKDSQELFILLLESNQKPVALCPFILSKKIIYGMNLKTLSFISDYVPGEFLIGSEEGESIVPYVLDYLIKNKNLWDLLWLRDMRESSAITQQLISGLQSNPSIRFLLEKSDDAPFIEVKSDWESYLKSLSPRFRGSLRNSLNGLNRLGAVRTTHYSQPDEIEEGLALAYQVAKKSWQGQSQSDISVGEYRTFLDSFVRKGSKRGWININILWTGDLPVAFEINTIYEKVLCIFKCGYNLKNKKFSPGTTLFRFTVEKYMNSKVREIDLMGAQYNYYHNWTKEIHPYVNCRIFNPKLKTIYPYIIKGTIIPRLKKIKTWVTAGSTQP